MQLSKIFIIFIIISAIYAFSADYQSTCDPNYSGVKISRYNTKQPVMINSNTTIFSSKHFLDSTSSMKIAIFKKQGTQLHLQIKGSTSTTYQSANLTNKFILLESIADLILVKEIISTTQFSYVIYRYNTLKTDSLSRFPFPGTLDDKANNLTIYSFVKIVEFDSTNLKVYVVLSALNDTNIYYLDFNDQTTIHLYAKTDSKKLNIIGGNKDYIYDSTSQGLYTYVDSETPMTFKNITSLTTKALYKSIKIVDLMGSTSLIGSFSDDSLSLIGFLVVGKGLTSSQLAVSSSTPILTHSDNYQNFLIISSQSVIWIHIFQNNMSLIIGNSSLLGVNDLKEVLNDFNQALYVAFDKIDCFVMSQKTIIKYRINANGIMEKLVVNQVAKNLLRKMINSDANQEIQAHVECACYTPEVVKLTCFAGSLQCYATTQNTENICTV